MVLHFITCLDADPLNQLRITDTAVGLLQGFNHRIRKNTARNAANLTFFGSFIVFSCRQMHVFGGRRLKIFPFFETFVVNRSGRGVTFVCHPCFQTFHRSHVAGVRTRVTTICYRQKMHIAPFRRFVDEVADFFIRHIAAARLSCATVVANYGLTHAVGFVPKFGRCCHRRAVT